MTTGPARHAEDAAEALRALNHATRPAAGGLAYPADAYDVTGHLAVLAARLPQALAQILAFLNAEAAAGRFVIVTGPHEGDPAAVLAETASHLNTAAAAASRLHQALDHARNALTWAGAAGPAGG